MNSGGEISWLAVDWGTSNLRVWAIGPGGETVAERSSDRGMSVLAPGAFEAALLDLIGNLPSGDRLDVVVCGMAGARQGWCEAPYAETPCVPLGSNPVTPPVRESALSVRIIPGICQRDPADVMRGEETQIAGLLGRQPDFDGLVCLPGTHTKWVRVAGGRILSFRTAMSGELHALLSKGSVLRHAIGAGWDDAAFDAALGEALADPVAFPLRLFAIRADSLLSDLAPAAARARLSGLLIGAELAALRQEPPEGPVVLVGPSSLVKLYARGLARMNIETRSFDGVELTLAGLTAAHDLYGRD
jgi:2-dehydro-3-deoxygalactonokinase